MTKPPFFLSLPAYFSPAGRISRLQYFVFGLILMAIFLAILMPIAFSGMVRLSDDGNPLDLQSLAIYSLPQLAVLYVVTCFASKRAHDLGWSGWLALLMVFDVPVDMLLQGTHLVMTVPKSADLAGQIVDGVAKVAQIGLGLMLTFRPGVRGANTFGPDPLKAPTPVEVF